MREKKKCSVHRQGQSSPRRFSCTTIFRNVANHSPNQSNSVTSKNARIIGNIAAASSNIAYLCATNNSWKCPAELLQKSEGRTYLPFRQSLANQRINYPTVQLSLALHLYNSHDHTPIRLSNPTTTLTVKCRYFSRSIGHRNIARRQTPFLCLQSSLPRRAVPKVTVLMVTYDRRSGAWRLSYEVCQVHTNKSTHILLHHHSINTVCNCNRALMG